MGFRAGRITVVGAAGCSHVRPMQLPSVLQVRRFQVCQPTGLRAWSGQPEHSGIARCSSSGRAAQAGSAQAAAASIVAPPHNYVMPPAIAVAAAKVLAPLVIQLTQSRMASLPRPSLLLIAQLLQLAGAAAAPPAWWAALCSAWVAKTGEGPESSTVAFIGVLAEAVAHSGEAEAGQPASAQLLMGPKAGLYLEAMYDEVARCAATLAPEQALSFLRACVACGEPRPMPYVLRTLACALCSSSCSSSRPATESRVSDPRAVARALVLLSQLGARPEDLAEGWAETVVAQLHQAVMGGSSVPPLLLLEACQAACSLGCPALPESLVAAALHKAARHLAQHPVRPAAALTVLDHAATCLRWAAPDTPSAPPSNRPYPVPPHTSHHAQPSAPISQPLSTNACMQQLAATVCALVAPQLQAMPTSQITELLDVLLRVGYRPVAQPQLRVSGAGPHPAPSGSGPMVNQYHITVLPPPAEGDGRSSSSGAAAAQGMHEHAGAGDFGAAATTGSRSGQTAQAATQQQQAQQPVEFVPALHAALLQRVPDMPDTDTLMDVLRPMATLRLLPPREAMLRLAPHLPPTSQPARTAMPQTAASGGLSNLGPHGLVMYLFLWASTGCCPPSSTLKAVQRQLAPNMQQLSPADLTSAVWAVTVLTGLQASAAGSLPLTTTPGKAAPIPKPPGTPVTATGTDPASVAPPTETTNASANSDTSSSSNRVLDAKGVLDEKVAAAKAAAAGRPLPAAWTRLNNTASDTRTLADIMSANTANAARNAAAEAAAADSSSGSSSRPSHSSSASPDSQKDTASSSADGHASYGASPTTTSSPIPRFVQEDWFRATLAATQAAVARNALAPHQLAFTLGSLQKLSEAAALAAPSSNAGGSSSMASAPMSGTPQQSPPAGSASGSGASSSGAAAGQRRAIPAGLIDAILESFTRQLPLAVPSDMALLLTYCARLNHVPSYAVMDALVESESQGSVVNLMPSFSPRELASVAWSLARMHHRPAPEVTSALLQAAESALESATADAMAALAWAVAEQPPAEESDTRQFMGVLCETTRSRLSEFAPRDLVSLLSALGRVKFQPDTAWMSDALSAISVHLPFIDPPGYVAVLDALVALDARAPNTRWWAAFCRTMQPLLARMSPADLACSANLLLAVGHKPDADWQDRWMQAVDGLCTTDAVDAAAEEELLAATVALGVSEASALQIASLEQSLAGLSALGNLAPTKLVRLVCSISALADRGAAHLPSAGWVGGPLVEAVRGALPRMQLKECADLARVLGPLAARPEYSPSAVPALHDLRAYLREYFLYSG